MNKILQHRNHRNGSVPLFQTSRYVNRNRFDHGCPLFKCKCDVTATEENVLIGHKTWKTQQCSLLQSEGKIMKERYRACVTKYMICACARQLLLESLLCSLASTHHFQNVFSVLHLPNVFFSSVSHEGNILHAKSAHKLISSCTTHKARQASFRNGSHFPISYMFCSQRNGMPPLLLHCSAP